MPSLSPKAIAAATLLAAIAFAASPFFFEPFSGFNPEDLPRNPGILPLQPEGYAFAIWGVIYLWLIAGCAFGLLKRAQAPGWQPMRPALLLSLTIGAAWIPVALTAPVASTVLIIAMLITALIALFRAPATDAALAAAPVALYAGWLSAAAIVASATITAAYTALSPLTISIAGLVLVGAVACAVIKSTAHPIPYFAAVLWALIGVIVANLSSDTLLVFGGAIGVIAALSYTLFLRLRPKP